MRFPPELNTYLCERDKDLIKAGEWDTFSGRIRAQDPPNFWDCLSFSGAFIMRCCGAGTLEDMAVMILGGNKGRQNYLSALINGIGLRTTRYYILSDNQLEEASSDSLISLLEELGAYKVDETPNQNHGPNRMHLFVWSPRLNIEKLQEYLYIYPEEWPHESVTEPLWWHEMTEMQQIQYIRDNQDIIDVRQNRKLELETKSKNREIREKKIMAIDWIKDNPEELHKLGWTKQQIKI